MNNKFKLTDETITFPLGRVLHRIQALKDFGDVKKGELGGFIEKEENLSVENNCWVYDDAWVFSYARISDNACIRDNARIFGNACVSDNAHITDNAHIAENARIFGNAHVHGNACVRGNAYVYGDAVLKEQNFLSTGSCCTDIQNNLAENIRVQTNLIPVNGEVIAYKQVNKDLSSFHDPSFIYTIGKWAEVTDYDPSSESYAKGLHFSNPSYWNRKVDLRNSTLLIAKIKLEDIITVQNGKIRCKKAFILGTYDVE